MNAPRQPETAAGRALWAGVKRVVKNRPDTDGIVTLAEILAIEQEARAAGIRERDDALLTHGQINVGTIVGYEAGIEEGQRLRAAEGAAAPAYRDRITELETTLRECSQSANEAEVGWATADAVGLDMRGALTDLADDVERLGQPLLSVVETLTNLASYKRARALLATPAPREALREERWTVDATSPLPAVGWGHSGPCSRPDCTCDQNRLIRSLATPAPPAVRDPQPPPPDPRLIQKGKYGFGAFIPDRVRESVDPEPRATAETVCIHGVHHSQECPECGYSFVAADPEPTEAAE